MKFISSIIVLFFFSFSNGQSFEKTQKIVFHYKKGHYNFLKKGNYGVEEIIEFEKNSKNIFEVKKITQIKNSFEFDKETQQNTLKKDDSLIKKTNTLYFDKTYFDNLIHKLNYHDEKIKNDSLSFFLKNPSRKEILSIAKKYNIEHYLIDDETNQVDEFGKEKIKKISQLNSIEEFLQKINLRTDLEIITNDAWNNLNIKFIEQNNETEYLFDFITQNNEQEIIQVLGQPFTKMVKINKPEKQKLINFSVNKILLEKMPKESFIYQNLDFNHLKEFYIVWFIRNKN